MRTKTLLSSALFGKAGESMQPVSLPHTWNAFDGQDGGNDYWRGTGIYQVQLPDPTPGMRQYIELRGAGHVTTVSCNGHTLGTHKGGFSTFRYDLTDTMGCDSNVLTVAVSNAPDDVYPQKADFTFFGGLYRAVNYIEVAPAHFDLLKDGTDAVFVTPSQTGSTRIDLFPVNAGGCTVTVELTDPSGNTVACGKADACGHVHMELDVPHPQLWDGIEDPCLYNCHAAISRNGKILDSVSVEYGYRSFCVDPQTGFWLNGRSIPLRGVCRHQDRQDKGWAISKADHEEDIALIREMGANTIRLAHYQHDPYFYDLCDRAGFVLWAEIPFISHFIPTAEAYENSMSQLKELIAQNYNRPSIFFWGISNEILIGGDSEALVQNLLDLNTLAKTMDPSRLTTIAQLSRTPVDSAHNQITDLVSYNHYFGWYGGDVSMNGPWMDQFHTAYPSIPLGISEYGVENIVSWHSAKPMNHDYTEEYASFYHHEMLKTFASRPYLWSTYVWNAFDFAADNRREGGIAGRNNKGLITYDRKVKKDAFYIYKAYWTKEPMVHIAGRRFVDRAPDERSITVYTNCASITLRVNGKETETKEAVQHAVVFENPPLQEGSNTVTATGCGAEDTVILNAVSAHNPAYTLPSLAEAMKAGNWFDEMANAPDSEEITVSNGCYSIKDDMKTLLASSACFQIIKGWLMAHNNLALASMLETQRSFMERQSKIRNLSAIGSNITPKTLAQLNRQLSKVRKEQ